MITHPEERVQGSVLHKLCDDHDWTALCHHTLQTDDVRMVKLAHNGCLRQEVPPLLVHIASLQGLDGDIDLSLSRQFQTALVHLAKFTCRKTQASKSKVKLKQ